MFKHNLLLLFRGAKRNKGSFFINLIGLSTGLACALLIYLWVNDELHVNKFNEHDDRIYQVLQNFPGGENIQTTENTPGILAEVLKTEIPEVEYTTSVVPASRFQEKGVMKVDETTLKLDAQYVSKDYFEVFSCPLIVGNKDLALNDKHSILVSENLAIKLFGTTNNITGKTVTWNQNNINGMFQITGIFKDLPVNATEKFDLIFNYDVFLDANPWVREWGNSNPSTFVLLNPETNISALNAKLENFLQAKLANSKNKLFAQKYSERYLHGRYENGVLSGGRIEYVHLFSIIALFILLIACINFMNLSTARASKKFKEVGVKKVVGANRQTLIFQYLSESVFMTSISLVLSVALVAILLPNFNEITGKHLVLHFGINEVFVLLFIVLVTGFIAGSYPALYISGFKPVEILKGKLNGSLAEFLARKGLVVFQFTISVILIVSVLLVYKQIEFIQSKNLGYNRENVIHFNAEKKPENSNDFLAYGGKLQSDMETFISEVKKIPGVLNAATYNHDLTGKHGGIEGVDWEEGENDDKMYFSKLEVGYNFIETLGIQMSQGRNFSSSLGNETSKVIFNEEAIKKMGLNDPVGKIIKVWGQEKQIIGVTKNFNFESLFENVKPCIIQLEPRTYNIMVKMNTVGQKGTIEQLGKLFHERNPGLAFDYKFVDDDYQSLYVAEKRVSILSRYFAGIAILISCLGLFGLATFSAQKRTKEISIRKILGSGEFGIIRLLSNEFTGIVITAIFIAMPTSYFVMHKWLEGFAYKTSLSWWIFALAGLLALGIALLTVSWQSWRAATRNPVEALRYE
jgi:ABC-type antimicrobial peptide transport system permease subunit